MSFLQRQKFGMEEKFFFDGSRVMDAVLYGLKKPGQNVEVVYNTNNTQDLQNIAKLKEEMGTLRVEIQVHQQFTRNNENNEDRDKIKNASQNEFYQDLLDVNNMIAATFLNFFQKFYWRRWSPEVLKSNADGLTYYKKQQVVGLPSKDIIDEIKTVYPQMHNLFVKMLELKHGEKANLALMDLQDAKEQLKEAELIGQIQKIVPKKNPKIGLLKKK